MKFQTRWTAIIVVCAFVLGTPGLTTAQDEEPALTIGSAAPAIDVEHWVSDGKGQFGKVTEFEKGKVYIVEFWATWCGPCIASMPHLAETQKKYSDKGVQIISISDEDIETVNKFLERKFGNQQDEEEAAEDDQKESEDAGPATYGELTSAYCLTTDPDGSVQKDYMEAAGQNGIPTCFIVGKEGHIEWIGHPMEMDEPLSKVVSDKWDRVAYHAEFKKAQRRDTLVQKIMVAAQGGETEEAMGMLREAREEYADDAEFLTMLEQFEFQIQIMPIIQKFRSGETEEAEKDLTAFAESATGSAKFRANVILFQMAMQAENTGKAAETLKGISSMDAEPEVLNQLAWSVYEMAAESADTSADLVDAARSVAEKAVELDPENGVILDTLAHLVHLQGNLDRAIELQTRAMKNPGQAAADIEEFLEQLKKEKADQDK